jgi:hypothetical protein
MSSPLCFMDTETLGLNPDAPVWEFAAIRIDSGGESRYHCFIDHRSDPWIEEMMCNNGAEPGLPAIQRWATCSGPRRCGML